ncbi:MAG: DNA recombination protein RmuC [Bacteroidales bacterium]|nr:DNA recombination protein RmuC [Bacteroidales bacterium]
MEPISLIVLVIVGLLLIYIAIKISKKPTSEETSSNKENIELLNERERLKTIISNFETQVKEKQQEIISLNSKINDLNEQNKELSNEVVKLIESNKVANNDLLKKDSEIIELKQNLESSNSTNAKKDKEITELKGQNSVLIEKLDNANNLNNKSQNELEKLKEDYKEQNKKHSETLALLEAEKEKSQNIQQSFTEYKLSLENLNKQNEAHIQNITNKILEEKTKKFTEQNSKEIELLVSPLKEQINDFKKKVEEGNIKQVELHTELKSQIENVIKQTNSISEDAVNLTKALKGENKRAGNWGEHVLETILENSGLIKGQHYESQQSVKTEDNQRLIPDFIVHLPSSNSEEVNNIVIDSKLSLVAYERYFNSQTEEEKETNLQDHIKSVKNHIDELANKKYENVVNGSIGFVMMFIPVEPAYLLAVQSDNSLWEYAYNKKIVLISASNMITSLRLIADIWKINTRNKEAEAMADTCGAIYDKILGFLDTFENVGNAVKKAQDEYEKAKGQLTTGNGNVVKRLKELSQKGIKSKTKKSLPTSFESYDE